MSKIILESNAEAIADFEKFKEEYPEVRLQKISNFTGEDILKLIIENADSLTGAAVILFSSIKAKGITIKISKDGVAVTDTEKMVSKKGKKKKKK